MIWLNVLIPIILIIIGYIYFTKKIAWFESVIMLLIALATIGISKYSIETSMTNDVEYIQDYIVNSKYYEEWNEWIYQTCETCTTDSEGNQDCTTYDCSYQDTHYAYWTVTTSNGKSYSVNRTEYDRLVRKFGIKPIFKDMHRDYDTQDGDMYYTKFDGDFSKLEYTTWEHTYENRVQASHTILNYEDVTEEQKKKYNLVDYPNIHNYYKARSILGEKNKLDEYVNKMNSLISNKKQVKIFYIIFKNQPRNASLKQEQYWKRGNKNEVVICIGLDKDRNIEWGNVFSWGENNYVNVDIVSNIEKQKKLDNKTFKEIIDYSHKTTHEHFKRKKFSDFSYLRVDPSPRAMWITFTIVLITNLGMLIFIIANDIDSDYSGNSGYNRFRRRF